jgi:hypothetical protein
VEGTFRVETLHLASFIIFCAFFLFLLVLLCIFSRCQPLKSRGITPFVGWTASFVYLISKIYVFFFTIEETIIFGCKILYFVVYPITISMFLMIIVHYFRGIVLLFLDQKKILFIENKIDSSILFKRRNLGFKILKIIIHPITNITLIVLNSVLWSAFFSLYFKIFSITCLDSSAFFLRIVYVIVILINFLLFTLDFILNFNYIRKCQWKQILMKDAFWYRSEIAFFTLLVNVPLFALTTIFKFFNANYIVITVLNSLTSFGVAVQLFICPLILTMISFILGKFSKPKKTIQGILENQEERDLFYQFCASEYSQENILCFEKIEKFKREKDAAKKKDLALEIKGFHLNSSDSILEVNVNWKTVQRLNQKISANEFEVNLFDEVQKEIEALLGDTYTRYLISFTYRNHLKLKKTISG